MKTVDQKRIGGGLESTPDLPHAKDNVRFLKQDKDSIFYLMLQGLTSKWPKTL